MRNFKRFLALFLALVTLTSAFYGCGKSKQTEEPEEEESREDTKLNNLERYFLYADGGKLYRLDAVAGQTKEISLDFAVDGIVNALVCDNNERMVARIQKEESDQYGLIYWDGQAGQAKYLGDSTELLRISKDGIRVWYFAVSEYNKHLYCYDAKTDTSKKIVEYAYGAAIADDGRIAFVGAYRVDETTNEATWALYFATPGGEVTEIAPAVTTARGSVSQDYAAICYMKLNESDPEYSNNSQAYLWTKEGGEKQLPFYAMGVQMLAPNEIYYQRQTASGYSQYYYDGNQSHLLAEDGRGHGHKIDEDLYYYRAKVDGENKCFVAYKGKSVETKILYCPQMGETAFVKRDTKNFYGITDSVMYRVRLSEDGTLTEEKCYDSPAEKYSPRYLEFQNGYMLCNLDGKVYLNDKLIVEDADRVRISMEGNLLYQKDGELCCYADGSTTKYRADESVQSLNFVQGGRVLTMGTDNRLTLYYREDGDEKTITFGTNIAQLCPVECWSCPYLIDVPLRTDKTGVWFHGEIAALAWL